MKIVIKKTVKITVLLMSAVTFAQVGIGTVNPEPSSALDISSTTQGFLAPRMTSTERMSISSPATGLLVYDTVTESLWAYNSNWKNLDVKFTDGMSLSDAVFLEGNVGVRVDNPIGRLHLKTTTTDPSLVTTTSSQTPPNQMLIIENNSTLSGANLYPGITLLSKSNSCGHIIFGNENDNWLAEIDYNMPTNELSFHTGVLNTNERPEFQWSMNTDGKIFHGSKTSDQALANYRAQLTVDDSDNYGDLTGFSTIRGVSPYQTGSPRGASITGGLTGSYEINQFGIWSTYNNNNWSSDIKFGVRDETSGSDTSSDFSNLQVFYHVEGDTNRQGWNTETPTQDFHWRGSAINSSFLMASPADGTSNSTLTVSATATSKISVSGPGAYISLQPSSESTSPSAGDIYYDNTLNVLRYFNGTNWVGL